MKEILRMEVCVEPIVARFGEAILVKTSDRRFELRGGSSTDVIEAREWISMFLPDMVVRMKESLIGQGSLRPALLPAQFAQCGSRI
jgi:hypothetical protein